MLHPRSMCVAPTVPVVQSSSLSTASWVSWASVVERTLHGLVLTLCVLLCSNRSL